MKITSKQIKYLSKIKNSLYDDIKIEFLYHSNHLEGSTFTKSNLEKLLDEKRVEGTHMLDDIIETKNSLDVFDKVVIDSNKKIDKYMLFDWQRSLKYGTVDEEIGNTGMWKKYGNKLRGVKLELAYPEEVDNLMYNLIEDWNEIENPSLKDIAEFHYKFERIHPFQDGNGRIGRFIILKQCIESNIDLVAIDDIYKDEYKDALYTAQTTNNPEKLVDIFKKCQERLDSKFKNYNNLLEKIDKDIIE